MTTHNPRSHSGWQTAARRRNEEWIACLDCSVVSRSYRPEDDYDEERWPWYKTAFVVVVASAFLWSLIFLGLSAVPA